MLSFAKRTVCESANNLGNYPRFIEIHGLRALYGRYYEPN